MDFLHVHFLVSRGENIEENFSKFHIPFCENQLFDFGMSPSSAHSWDANACKHTCAKTVVQFINSIQIDKSHQLIRAHSGLIELVVSYHNGFRAINTKPI